MSVSENINQIREIIAKKQAALGITYPIELIGVTKTLPSSAVREAASCGITIIGESKVQEAEKKFLEISDLKLSKHMIGHLQENKANKAASLFDMVQSIDSLEIAKKMDRKMEELQKTMPILIEINTSGDSSKYGIAPERAAEIAGQIKELSHLSIKGLMTIGPLDKPLTETRKSFQLLYQIRENLEKEYPGLKLPVLSMGMSDDFEIAIEEGSTMLRLGRILFGERIYQ